jgi:hypothetical protein
MGRNLSPLLIRSARRFAIVPQSKLREPFRVTCDYRTLRPEYPDRCNVEQIDVLVFRLIQLNERRCL